AVAPVEGGQGCEGGRHLTPLQFLELQPGAPRPVGARIGRGGLVLRPETGRQQTQPRVERLHGRILGTGWRPTGRRGVGCPRRAGRTPGRGAGGRPPAHTSTRSGTEVRANPGVSVNPQPSRTFSRLAAGVSSHAVTAGLAAEAPLYEGASDP